MTATSAEAPTLLLLNGITRSADSWAPLRDLLSDRPAVALEGVGVEAGPAAVRTIPEQARRIVARMDADGLRRADILGFSHGGLVAQQLAFAAPSRVGRLILVSTSCGAGATVAAPSWGWGARSSAPALEPRAYGVVAAQMVANANWSSIPFLGGIAAPTLIIHGVHDRLVPVENARVLARRIPGAELALLDFGHDLQREEPMRQVAHLVSEFLGAPLPRHA